MNFYEAMVFSMKDQKMGYPLNVDFVKGEYALSDEDGNHFSASFEDAKVILPVGSTEDGDIFYNHDVFKSNVSGTLYELELIENGRVQFYSLNQDLERELSVDIFTIDKFIKVMENSKTYELHGNLYELRAEEQEKKVFPNIAIVKMKSLLSNELEFHYAGFLKDTEEVDLIKAVFVGSNLFDDTYQRATISLEEYMDMKNSGFLVEATPAELQKYALEKFMADRPTDVPVGSEEDCDGYCEDCDCKDVEFEDGLNQFDADDAPVDYPEKSVNCIGCDFPEEDCECELYEKP